jgi:prepilin-type N-terminal cleavage/methylation domain-containing protein
MRHRGYSLIEVLACLAIAVIVAGAGTPALLAARDGARTTGALDYLAGQFHAARLEALKRHAYVAVRFEREGTDYQTAVYLDGNGNGVRAADIDAGVDIRIRGPERIADQYPGVSFGLAEGVAGIEAGETLEPGEPIRFGRSAMVSFSPTGTSSSGTAYLVSNGHRQSAVRVLGVTGRVRTLTYNFEARRWQLRW